MDKYTIGVDVGGTNVKLGLVNPFGKIVLRGHLSTKDYPGQKALIQAISHQIQGLIRKAGVSQNRIQGIGIGIPGLIDPHEGVVLYLPNIPGWKNVPLRRIIEAKLKIPTYIENDVNLISLAEWKLGAGKGYKNLICITLGTGVGGGLILNNALYRGEGFFAGEIGHMPLESSTLELHVGNRALQQKASRIFKKKNIQMPDIFPLAKKKDPRAIKFWKEIGVCIGTTLAGVVNLLNPALIIIGGGVSNNFPFFNKAIKDTVQQRALKIPAKMVRIVRARLGNDAGILGAPILIRYGNIER